MLGKPSSGKERHIFLQGLPDMPIIIQGGGLIIFKWLDQVVHILNETGFSYVFILQLNLNGKHLQNVLLQNIKNVVRDQAKQALIE